MKKVQNFFAILLAMLLFDGTLAPLRAQQRPASPAQVTTTTGLPAGYHQNGGVTPGGRHYDYKKVEGDKTTYLRVLRTREEIDRYLQEQAAVNLKDSDMQELAKAPWYVMKTHWRSDPVTSSPITSIPPNPKQLSELNKAINERLVLSEKAKKEFKRKLTTGDCISRSSLDPARFVVMVNGTGTNIKIEVPEQLAKQTKSCEFFLESEPIVINLILICGNFGFTFTDVWFDVTTPPAEELKPPSEATCLRIQADPSAKQVSTGEYEFNMNETIRFTAMLRGDTSVLGLTKIWNVNKIPKFGASDTFVFSPAMVDYQPGRYAVDLTVTDKFGRRSVCPTLIVNLVRASPPPVEVSQTPPPAKEKVPPPPKEPGRPCKVGPVPCWVAGLIAAGVGGGIAAALRGGKSPAPPNPTGIIKIGTPAPGVTALAPITLSWGAKR